MTALKLLNLASPTWPLHARIAVPFLPQHNLCIDIFTDDPKPTSTEPGTGKPVIVFFYGGSWQRGSRQSYRFVASQLARAGFVVMIPDYRLYPTVIFPEFMADAAAAVAWALSRAGDYGGDPHRLYVMGHSAGAQIAALLHYDTGYLQATGAEPRPAGLIGLSGPYDFLPLTADDLKAVFPEPVRAASQPVHFANGNAGPALLLHGGSDETVHPGNSKRLARQVQAKGGEAQVIIYPRRGHAGVLLALARPLTLLAPVVADVCCFIKQAG